MFPEKLEYYQLRTYFEDRDCFCDDPDHLVHAYIHNNYNIKMHSHQFYEMNIITAGDGHHYIGNSSLPARVGDVFVIPPKIYHGYYSEGTLDICHILMRSEFFSRYRNECSALPGFELLFDIEPHLRRSSGSGYNLHADPRELGRIMENAKRIIDAETNSLFIYQNVLTLSFIGTLGYRLREKTQNSAIPDNEREILRVMEYIKMNLDQSLSLSDLAAFSNMSISTLNRRFARVLNTTVMQYVLQCRLEKARRLLEDGKLSKADIAAECGFYDSAHMNKYLHKGI